MPFIRSFKGHWIYSTTRKKPEVVFHDIVEHTKTFYINAISEAIYLVVQLPKGNPNTKVSVKCYQALTNDGSADDTEPTTVITFDNHYSTRVQKSDIVLTLAPYVKVEIEVTEPTEVKVYKDYM